MLCRAHLRLDQVVDGLCLPLVSSALIYLSDQPTLPNRTRYSAIHGVLSSSQSSHHSNAQLLEQSQPRSTSYKMAAASRQPEMAELPAAALHGNPVSTSPAEGVVGASDNQASDGQGRPVSTTAHDAHPLSTTPESGHPAMHTVATTGNNEDDDIDGVRGADSGLAASTNGDNATITSRRSEEALKSIPTTQPPVVTTSEPLAVNKDVASTAMPSLGSGPRDGQEQGDQVTLELVRRQTTLYHRSMSIPN